jgi:5,5'-dehydrodivanillate O-demethylase
MVLTKEQNDMLTQVGPGTPGGELLRRYWHPITVAAELTVEHPTKFVRILGEDLVLFKDKSGNVGLIQDHCVHRGASLLYGRVEERGIACAYHGWLYDTAGNCLECPAEPEGSKFHLTVKAKAYPVQRYAGLYWAYLGPLPAPAITKYDVLARTDGRRSIHVFPNLDCNWFAAAENAVDPWHLSILHQDQPRAAVRPANTTRGYVDDIKSNAFYLTTYGIMKKRTYASDRRARSDLPRSGQGPPGRHASPGAFQFLRPLGPDPGPGHGDVGDPRPRIRADDGTPRHLGRGDRDAA